MTPRRRGAPFFSSIRHTARERSAGDVATLIAATVSVFVLSLVAVPPSGFETAVIGLLEAVPSWLDLVWWVGAAALASWVLAVSATALARRRWDVLLDAGASVAAATGLALLVAHRINGSWPGWSQILTGGADGTVPLAALTVGASFVAAVSAHLARPYRRFGGWILVLGAVSVAVLGGTTPVGVLVSLALGVAAAASVHVALGASAGRPTVAEVADALDELGVSAHDLHPSADQVGGVVALDATDDDGGALRVKVYGRDARDAQVLSQVWRGLWYRGGASATTGRLQQVEHEAFVTLFAAAKGVPVPEVQIAGRDARGDSLIVVADPSEPLGDRSEQERSDALPAVWRAVRDLHALGLTHGELSPASFGVADDRVTVRDLSPVTLGAADDRKQQDLAQTLVSTAAMVGIERAAVTAGDELGADGVTAMLAYLQTAALGATLRRQVKSESLDIDALRSALAGVVDVEVPEVVELRRVRPQSLATIALIALVAFALISSLGDIDVAELVDEIRGASLGWVVAALVAAQLPFLSQAVATRGACPVPVPLGPLTLLQSGIGFVALAVPSTAGRLALDIRFFQRQGLPATSAVSISAIDGFSGFLVQMSLLVLTLGVGLGGVSLSFDGSTGGGSSGGASDLVLALGVLAAAVVVLAVVAMALPGVRSRVVERVRPVLGQVGETVRSLRSPVKLLQLFGGNLANQLLFAVALGLCLEAFGGRLDLATLVTIYVAAALFGGLMPVPGGVGVMEAALTAGLVAAGVDATTGAATAILFRLVTFYLPPLWGWLSLRWLRHHDYL